MELLIAVLILAAVWAFHRWVPPVPSDLSATAPPRCVYCVEWRQANAQLQQVNVQLQQRIERNRGYRDQLHQALSRVRDHHLPGFRMDPTGMCPICKDTKIFDLAQALLGQMTFDVPPPPDQPEDSED